MGSNNGAWTAAYLRTHPDAAVFLLEPNPRFEEELRLIETRYDAVHVRAAAWIADGNATFHFSRNDESSSLIAGMIRCNARSCATPCSIQVAAYCAMHCGSFFSRRAGRADKWASTAPRGRAFACRPASTLGTATAYARRPEVWNGSIPRRHGRSAVCDEPRRRAIGRVRGHGCGQGQGFRRGPGRIRICHCAIFDRCTHRRRVATVDLARLVSCAACPSDRLELHLDIEGAEYEVC